MRKPDDNFDVQQTTGDIISWIQHTLTKQLKKKGAIVGISGGIDSSVVAALCVAAVGNSRVTGIALPERECSAESITLAQELAEQLGIPLLVEDITNGLDGMGAYERRDEAIRKLFPDLAATDKVKLTIDTAIYKRTGLNVFRLTVVDSQGNSRSARPGLEDYLTIVAASNMKQRLRMTMLYYHAELRNYAVVGTGNRNEHDLGFFVKYGDGGADLKPIVHLFKSQVYEIAEYLNLPQNIIERPPTTDTYSAEVTQEEFFFQIPFETLDAIWTAYENGTSIDEISNTLGKDTQYIQGIIRDIHQKHKTTEYLRAQPLKMN